MTPAGPADRTRRQRAADRLRKRLRRLTEDTRSTLAGLTEAVGPGGTRDASGAAPTASEDHIQPTSGTVAELVGNGNAWAATYYGLPQFAPARYRPWPADKPPPPYDGTTAPGDNVR